MHAKHNDGVYGPVLLPRRRRRCFYCSCALVHRSCFPTHGPFPDNLATRDHVFPRSRLTELGIVPSETWLRLNRVPACAVCNNAKGAMPPDEWLSKLPCPDARHRLQGRLHSLRSLLRHHEMDRSRAPHVVTPIL